MSPESQILQQLPSVSKILQKESVQALINLYSREFVLAGIQECLDQLRAEIRSGRLSEQTLSERIAFLDST
ncbi:hypothetical protein MYX65_07305, partial [Acidobacteria bacterium AH-259-L09]|nr:hypothetical protein [Acidobacteria bacterium AH-259-L09]